MTPIRVRLTRRPQRTLDFDIETRKIGFHDGGRFAPSGCEPVIIACSWIPGRVETRSLGTTWQEQDARAMLEWFVSLWDEADLVTGHYLTKFDLPILSGCLLEWGYAPLAPRRVLDTQRHLKKVAGLSKSQENLSEMLKIGSKKFHAADQDWRSVARLTPEGLGLARKRVVSDVKQHKQLVAGLGPWLNSARAWSP